MQIQINVEDGILTDAKFKDVRLLAPSPRAA
ncbi:MAG: hypothetical protein ACXV5H_00255 [Halobacteriota archaeon]